MKKQILILVLALVATAALNALEGQEKWAFLCLGLAAIGVLLASFGFKKGFRCECSSCGKSVFIPKMIEGEAKESLQAAGWRVLDADEYCPECVNKGVGQITAQS